MITLNANWRVIADPIHWIAQRRTSNSRSGWKDVIFCQTRAGLIVNLGFEVFGVGEIESAALQQLQALPRHRLMAPGAEPVEPAAVA